MFKKYNSVILWTVGLIFCGYQAATADAAGSLVSAAAAGICLDRIWLFFDGAAS